MIEVKNITKKYGRFTAVDDISFEVNDHEVIGFLGPNGAGKSTTMNMITGYIEPTKGKIIINGHDISKSPIRAKKQIGYMPENVPLYNDLTVKEFVSYMAELKRVNRKERKQEVAEIIEKTGLTDVENKLIKNISRGYKQRTSLAGALVGKPDVLILDEPTVGLDPKQITEIRELIKELGKEHTVILSSHILSEVSQICERVVIINHGKIVAIDTPENLENKTKNENNLMVTVNDKDNKVNEVCKKIEGIIDVSKVKENDDQSVRYLISAKEGIDIRKDVLSAFTEADIEILELKKVQNSLEDAFLKIIDEEDEEVKNARLLKEELLKKRKEEIARLPKEEQKKARKEDREKIRKERKEAFDEEWEKEKAIAKKEKEERKLQKNKKKESKKEEKEAKKARKENKKELQKTSKAKDKADKAKEEKPKKNDTAKSKEKESKKKGGNK